MHSIHRLLLALGAFCLLPDSARAAVGGHIEARLVITAGCEVSHAAGAGLDRSKPLDPRLPGIRDNLAVSCGSSPNSPTQFTVKVDPRVHDLDSARTRTAGPYRDTVVVTLGW
ncbi:hypothetical protein HX881_22195 [Pseudomonas gingeri]|uniref:hypothetical protein n=1 Tax=Pseudomonas gingeri TaxID=117681 RepID=UPI0015A41159|nr:hypothetical protein [Pseudomonas gingeri]NVZ28278.1 hypothetical protein [Pseudomonas gingeri]